ncbi:MAG: hypothetical protein AAFU77_10770 [Myxococcota bacterium]
MTDTNPLQAAIENYNYPSEMGDPVHDSVEELDRLLRTLKPDSQLGRVVAWLKRELTKGYAYGETNDPGQLPTYTHVRAKDEGSLALEGSRDDGETWEDISPECF